MSAAVVKSPPPTVSKSQAPTAPLVRTPMSILAKSPHSSHPPKVEYSDKPLATINLAALTPSRFLLQRERALPYRDEDGRVNIHLVRRSIADVESGRVLASPAIKDRLAAWRRHAHRSLVAASPAVPSLSRGLQLELTRAEPEEAAVASGKRALVVADKSPRAKRRCTRLVALVDENSAHDNTSGGEGSESASGGEGAARMVKMIGQATPPRLPATPPRGRMHHAHLLAAEQLAAAEKVARGDGQARSEEGSDGGSDGSGEGGSDGVYEVAEILREGDKGFLIRWAGYGPEDDTWEPEAHVSDALVASFRRAQASALARPREDVGEGRGRRLWCSACGVHAPADNFSALMKRSSPASRECLKHQRMIAAVTTPPRPVTASVMSAERTVRFRKYGIPSLAL